MSRNSVSSVDTTAATKGSNSDNEEEENLSDETPADDKVDNASELQRYLLCIF